jgi:spermidine synthase
VFSHTGAMAAESPVAVLGLGTGSVACFGKKGQVFDFYEIDPVVASIASNTQYFTFLHDCPAKSNIIMGDGRLALANAQNGRYGIIVIDVFSSDAIPTHLLTQQALLMYKDKLTEDGILLFNISNRHLNLSRVMASLAPNVGMKAYIKRNMKKPSELYMPSVWVAMSRDSRHLDLFSTTDKQWKPLEADPDTAPWTDDYSNILHVLL